MLKIFFIFLVIVVIINLFFFSRLLKKSMDKENQTKLETISEKLKGISIITIYDNYQMNPELRTGWGFSCLIKINEKSILFDTGADFETLLYNMEKVKINPKDINFVFISHLHGDHTGGLEGILKIKSDLKVYKPDSFSKETEISEGIWTTGPLGIWIKEQSLIINSEKGLIVITGCAHPGVVNIIKKTKEIFPNENIYLVLGGFHLSGVSDSELRSIIKDFKELGVQKVAPCHCSGDRCRELFKQEYRDDFIENGVGKLIDIL